MSKRRRQAATGAAIAALVLLTACGVGHAEQAAAGISPAPEIELDLPAAPLAITLERFMAATEVAVVVDSTLAAGYRSAPLNGRFRPDIALRALLAGTGLDARPIGSHAYTLVRIPQRVRPLPRFPVFAAAIQAAVTAALCQQSDTRPMQYRAVVRLWFDPAGVVTRAELGSTTGDRDLDMTITRTLQHVDVGAPRPADLPQPVKLAIMPRHDASACADGRGR